MTLSMVSSTNLVDLKLEHKCVFVKEVKMANFMKDTQSLAKLPLNFSYGLAKMG